MAITLYDATVRSFLQTLTGVEAFMAKGLEHCRATGADPAEIVTTRLIADMHPFSFQIASIVHHSKIAIESAQSGVASIPSPPASATYEQLQAMVTDARKALEGVSPEAVNACEGRDVIFKIGENALPFLAEDFLMSFSLVNLHFHAATAYDILRMKGAPVGKRDYLGPMRLKMKA